MREHGGYITCAVLRHANGAGGSTRIAGSPWIRKFAQKKPDAVSSIIRVPKEEKPRRSREQRVFPVLCEPV
jgi:hypothetical protein